MSDLTSEYAKGLRHAAECLDEFDTWLASWSNPEEDYVRGARGVCLSMAKAFREAADTLDAPKGQ